jgi:dTDP-4-amino-4,6-dideoxygalactose transaminase
VNRILEAPKNRQGKGVEMECIEWGSFPLPLIQVNPPSIAKTNEILLKVYKKGTFSNSGQIHQEASHKLSMHVSRDFAGYLVSSNTSGLVACLLEIDVRDKHVLVSNFTFAATLNAIVLAGGIPVLCDIDPESLVLTLDKIIGTLEDDNLDIAAVVPTRVFGFISDFSELVAACSNRDIPVVIDAAATFPAQENVWAFEHQAKFEVFSLHATKVFGIGEGGLIVGNVNAIESVKERVNFGIKREDPLHFQDGLNAKADEFTAARALVRFSDYAKDVEIRKFFASEYKKIFENSKHIELMGDGEDTIYSYLPVIFDNEANLVKFMEHVNPYVKTRRYYFPSLSQGYTGNSRVEKSNSLATSESVSQRILCLPIYVSYSSEVKKQLMALMASAERLLN